MFFRSKQLENWAKSNNLTFVNNNKKDFFEFWADRNIIEGNYKGKNIKIKDIVGDTSGGGEGGISFCTIIDIDGNIINKSGNIKSFSLWGRLLSVKQISKILDEYISKNA